MKRSRLAVLLAGAILSSASADLSPALNDLVVDTPRYQPVLRGFEKAGKIRYEAGWNGIPTTDILLSLAKFHENGDAYYKMRIDVSNKKVLRTFWNPRNTIEAVILAPTLEPRSYQLRWRKGKKSGKTTVAFNRSERTVHSVRNNNGNLKQIHFFSENTYDPLSATLMALSQDLKVGDQLEFDAFNGKNRYKIGLSVAGEEEIQIGDRKTPAFKILPSIANLLNPSRSRDLSNTAVWISNDSARRILRVTSEAPLGYYYCDIVE